jgi:hypothetical protein
MDEIVSLRRGMILLALHAQYPHALTQAMLERAVGPFYEQLRGFSVDLAYLQEKGLCTSESTMVGLKVFVSYRITTKGIDLVDGAVEEPGIQIERPTVPRGYAR